MPTNSHTDLREQTKEVLIELIYQLTDYTKEFLINNFKNSKTEDALIEIETLIESTTARREQEARLEAELLQDQIDNYHKWFVEHRGDSLNEFLRSHAPSYIYGARLAQLLSSKTPPIQTKDKEK